MTDNEEMIEGLVESNKWWGGKFEIDFKPREIYEEIKRFLKSRQIVALTGLRRVGKTTIILKIAEDYTKIIGAKNIIYFSFDDFRDVKIRDIMSIYARIMNKDFNEGEYLLLLDEVQKLENWEEQVKRIYDNFKNIRIIVSGSESLFIRKKSRESLAGRFFEFKVKPLNLREYLDFRGIKIENIELDKQKILREFNSFLFCSGFPEIVNEGREIIKKYIKENVIEKIIYRDIPQVFPVREPSILEELFRIILLDPGEIISIDNLSKDLNASRQTISMYLDYLEKSFLIIKLYNFSGNIRKTQKKLKKYYPTIIASELAEKPESLGKCFELALVLQLDAEFFWRDTYKNEVDIVKVADNSILPIEIKYSKAELKPLKLFMKKFKVNKGVVITYDKSENIRFNGKEISIVPFYKYLFSKHPFP